MLAKEKGFEVVSKQIINNKAIAIPQTLLDQYTKDEIMRIRHVYNNVIETYNNYIQTFPNRLLTKIFNFDLIKLKQSLQSSQLF